MGTTKIAIATCALLATALATTSGFASATEPVGPQRDTDRDFIPDDEDTVETSGAIVSTGQRTLQSSVSSGRLRNHPGAAVDGQRDGGRDGQQPMAITNDDGPWWEVDLGADHAIDGINVWNRTDGQQHLLAGAEVFISTAPLGDVDLASARAVAAWTATISDPTNVVQLAVPHTIGRYVRVQLPSGATPNLALAEVDVIGVEEPTNLLVNGSFEQGPDLPGPGGWKFAVVPGWTSAEHGGRTEIQAAGHAAPSSDGDFYIELNGSVADTVTQTVTVTPGATYQWSVDHRGRLNDDTFHVLLDGTVAAVHTSAPGTWVTYTGEFTAATSRVTLGWRAVDSGSHANLIDNASLIQISPPDGSPMPEPTNLLVNGSFEQGPDLPGPGGWKFAVVPGWTSAKHGNRTEIQASGHAAPSSDGDFYIELNGSVADTVTQTVTVTPGATYQWSVDHRGRLNDDTFHVLLNGDIAAVHTSARGAWVTYTGHFTATTTSVTLGWRAVDSGSHANLIDNASLVLVTD